MVIAAAPRCALPRSLPGHAFCGDSGRRGEAERRSATERRAGVGCRGVERADRDVGGRQQVVQWLEGQREFPSFVALSDDKKLKQYPNWPAESDYKKWDSFSTGITKYKIKNYIFRCTWKEYQRLFTKSSVKHEWVDRWSEISNLSTATLKASNIEKFRPKLDAKMR